MPIAAAVIGATAAMHAVFFGAGRYGLVVAPFVALLAFAALARRGLGRASPSAVARLVRDAAVAEARSAGHIGGVDAARAVAGHRRSRRDGRKVRAPQSTMPGNARWRKRRGECNRKKTAVATRFAAGRR